MTVDQNRNAIYTVNIVPPLLYLCMSIDCPPTAAHAVDIMPFLSLLLSAAALTAADRLPTPRHSRPTPTDRR